jgi:tRNA dimethylallyltransferase
LPFEIVSVDSALIYKGMDIGTAKPTQAERDEIPHHLIDICDPKTPYSVADFCLDAKHIIDDIISRDKIPLLVGGTMMYFNALKNGLSCLPASSPIIRLGLEQQLHSEGLLALYQKLLTVDPIIAKKLHEHDTQRILRALEVYELTGTPLSEWQKNSDKKALNYDIRSFAVMPPERETLHQNIHARFDLMMSQGFMEEAQHLFNRGDLSEDLPSMRCVGYRQAWHYLSGEGDLLHMREGILAATRQLAKRQVTWLRKWADLSWFVPGAVESVLSNCNL